MKTKTLEQISKSGWAIFVQTTIFSTALILAGCGAQKSPVAVDMTNPGESSGSGSRIDIYIRNPSQFKRTAVDAAGNPERYAVDGELLEAGAATSQMLAGRTLCYSKLVNYDPYVGAHIRATYANLTKSEDGKKLQYLNITRLNETASSSISFVCMKLNYKVRPDEVRTAFGDLLKVVVL